MENLTHPRNPNKSSSSSLPKKKPYNGLTPGGGFTYTNSSGNTTTSTYDDVFGGPPRFGAPTLSPRLEDYCEIFSGSSRAAVSSIPVLDLPLVDGRDVYFDVRTQGFDYREVFGFNDLDLAPSYEDLFYQQRSTTVVGLCYSSDDAWTPEEVESCSGGTEHSGKSPCFSNGRDSYDSVDGSTEFNMSYNKASGGGDTNMSSGGGVIRVAGYTAAVDEMICAGGTTKETGPSSLGSRGTTSRFAFEDKYYTCEPFVTVSEIGLKTHPTGIPPPSRPPPVLKSGFRSSASNSGTTGSEGSADSSCSPPFFDVEVDASSAAVREAMVKAEAKLKNSKELFERKRDGARTTTKNRLTEESKPGHTAGLRDKRGSKSLSSQGSADSDEWKEANQFVELVRTELPRNADENSGGKDVCIPLNAEFFDQELTWAANGKLPKHPGTRKVASRLKRHEKKLAEKAPEEPKNEKSGHVELQFEMGNNLSDHGGIVKHRNLLRPEENKLFTEKPAKQKKELHCVEKTKRIQNQQSDRKPHQKAAEKNQECVFEWEQNARKLREALGNESMLEVSLESNGNGKKLGMRGESETKLNEALKRVEEETRVKEARVREENERREREAFEKAENEKSRKAALEQEEREKKIKVAREKEENERRVAEAREKAEQERKMKEQQELELRLKEAFEREEKNRRMREANEKAESERKMKVAFEQEKERRIKEAREKEENERRIKEALEEAERRLKETLEQEEKERQIKEFQEREENERSAKEALEQAETERRLKEALEKKEKERRVKEAREKEENEKRLKEAMELEEKEKRLIEAFERAEIERRLKEDLEQEEMRIKLQVAKDNEERERTHRENQEHQENERDSGEESDEKERDACEIEKTCETITEDHGEQASNESLSDSLEEDESIDNEEPVTNQKEEEEGPSQRESMSEDSCPWKVFEKNLKDASQKEGTNELDAESRLFERNEEAPQLSENGGYKQQNGESGEKCNSENIKGGKHKQKSKMSDTSKDASVLKRDNGSKTEVEERSEDVVDEDENVRKAAGAGRDQRHPEGSKCAPKTSTGFRNHENKFTHETQAGLNQDAKLERPLPFRVQREKEVERLKRERDFEMERLRKIEEEREREREREKDRMAFDQRALADARERLEKACAEAREKSLPDKLSIEARLRAERAAVERATAEARERAAEKAAFEARERMERSVSDKQFQSSGFFGERMERSVSDKQFQNSVSFGASRYQNSPGTDGESPQRYTSRLERHRRTADRVAKALAEKNMRDLVAQREQAERIRVAETLDAEVKRWSSGKEGNIRALLSTLQYILGPESGWQPIPLTEVITSAAVKRAYRKATLCVHPDKLQQRGANVHQKYICEKVFDLLKEAWNRFNSEER
ncbi:PREDICTED: auxilin-like protein 1 [Camelina sativa]|uniref:Auxilin-like protein 1 n=1 Tax=Camelina sativa TaxID=90675 RepID=A0ABM0U829_CAMSA|nr:PREDICTED: auxilin-like protein 1 [Camelina sativa]